MTPHTRPIAASTGTAYDHQPMARCRVVRTILLGGREVEPGVELVLDAAEVDRLCHSGFAERIERPRKPLSSGVRRR